MDKSVVVAEVIRNGYPESHHTGSVVVTAPDGTVEWSVGEVARPMFPRSVNKPMQALGMLRAGLRLDGELLALAAGSHAGEPIHVAGVRRMLASVGLPEKALRNPRAYPYDGKARNDWVREGNRRARVTMTCSGKHAAMLMTCVANGWPTVGYLDPDHPVQLAIRETVEEYAGERVASVAVDGCGAPLLAISLAGLSRAFGRLAKINDGAARARPVVLAATLQRLGLDGPEIRNQRERPIRGGRRPVGVIRPGPALAVVD
ncbi:hypothetical protein GCM10023321_43390 [Pseudonocardia eucalypti]|uniref:Asparaginase n=1 Tax=Pseudonocardia eucalypti TaxID=648755 RepID=A0ABP9QF93_9PSEU|nr:L-asparaginase II [Pseudonocardia eucalypti]